jgi:hypothetical protein
VLLLLVKTLRGRCLLDLLGKRHSCLVRSHLVGNRLHNLIAGLLLGLHHFIRRRHLCRVGSETIKSANRHFFIRPHSLELTESFLSGLLVEDRIMLILQVVLCLFLLKPGPVLQHGTDGLHVKVIRWWRCAAIWKLSRSIHIDVQTIQESW